MKKYPITPEQTQAYIYHLLFQHLRDELPPSIVGHLRSSVSTLYERLPDKRELDNNKLMIIINGDNESIFSLACARMLQLFLQEEKGNTFHLLVSPNINRLSHSGIIKNIRRSFDALVLDCDPSATLFMPQPTSAIDHFVSESFLLDMHCPGEKAFDHSTYAPPGQQYKADLILLGVDADTRSVEDIVKHSHLRNGESVQLFPMLTGVDNLTVLQWQFLYEFMGVSFDPLEIILSVDSNTDHLLMAHIQGLEKERLGGFYNQGILEYTTRRLTLMKNAGIPDSILSKVRQKFERPRSLDAMRDKLKEHALLKYDLTTPQLLCALYSPFVHEGAGLKEFLRDRYPWLLRHEVDIRHMLSDPDGFNSNPDLSDIFERISGMPIWRLSLLYRLY